MLNNKYKNDYKKTTYTGPDGKLRETAYYEGNFYVLPFDELVKKNINRYFIIFGVLFFLLFFATGMTNGDSSHTFWIVFPYLILFLPIGYNFIGTLSFVNAPIKMERAQYDGTVLRMKHSCQSILIIDFINIILDIIYILINRNLVSYKELLYCLGLVSILILTIFFGKYFDKVFSGIKEEKPADLL